MMVHYSTLVKDINQSLTINSTVRKDTHMHNEDFPGLSSRSLKLSAVDIFLNKFEGTRDSLSQLCNLRQLAFCWLGSSER